VQYLVTRYGPTSLAVTPDEPAYGSYLNFLMLAEATLTFPQTVYLRYTLLEPDERKLPQAAADYAQWFASRFKAAATLMGPHYACAERFTAADISLGYAVKLANSIGIAAAVPAAAQAYWERLQNRPALQRAEARENETQAA
jgi:glutathione S-transferase